MTLLLALAATTILEIAAIAEGHPSAYLWTVTSTSGYSFSTECEVFTLEVDESLWRFQLEVFYLHEGPYIGFPWKYTTEHYYAHPEAGLIFADGFELGNTHRWQ